MHKVCGAVHWVYDPGGFVCQDAGLSFSYRLLPNEAAAQKRQRTSEDPPATTDQFCASSVPSFTRVHVCVCVCVCMNGSPVRALSEFLLKRPDDDPLHPFISLGDEVHGGALCHNPYFALASFPDFLIK